MITSAGGLRSDPPSPRTAGRRRLLFHRAVAGRPHFARFVAVGQHRHVANPPQWLLAPERRRLPKPIFLRQKPIKRGACRMGVPIGPPNASSFPRAWFKLSLPTCWSPGISDHEKNSRSSAGFRPRSRRLDLVAPHPRLAQRRRLLLVVWLGCPRPMVLGPRSR